MGTQKFNYGKILIIGCGGAGKSTLAVTLGKKTGIPVVHLDKIWWLPEWKHRTAEEFDLLLGQELKKERWIMEGNFHRTFSERLNHSDFCIFLDYPKDVCMDGVYSRWEKFKGQTRPDMTEGCIEQIDPEFEEWVKTYVENVRPLMLNDLFASGVPYKIFTDRRQTELWLEETF